MNVGNLPSQRAALGSQHYHKVPGFALRCVTALEVRVLPCTDQQKGFDAWNSQQVPFWLSDVFTKKTQFSVPCLEWWWILSDEYIHTKSSIFFSVSCLYLEHQVAFFKTIHANRCCKCSIKRFSCNIHTNSSQQSYQQCENSVEKWEKVINMEKLSWLLCACIIFGQSFSVFVFFPIVSIIEQSL